MRNHYTASIMWCPSVSLAVWANAWLAGKGIAVRGLYTPYGRLGYSVRRANGNIVLHVDEGIRLPPGGIVFASPRGEVRIRKVPADVTVDFRNQRGDP